MKVLKSYRDKFDGKEKPIKPRQNIYKNIIELLAAEQFTWTIPETITTTNSHTIERAVNTGTALAYFLPANISRANSGFQITQCEFAGVLKNDKTSDTVITTGTDYSLQFDLTKDNVVLIKNNDYMYDENYNFDWFSEMLAYTDESEKAMILWSKLVPIAKATSGIQAEKLKEVMRNVLDGDLINVIDDNTKLITNQPMSRDDGVLRLTDDTAVERMHFLSEFHYELVRRLCNLYNIPFRTTAKSAQNLESELHNTDIFSQMIEQNRLKCRQQAAKEITAKLGVEISVDYSECLKRENKVIQENIESEGNNEKEPGQTETRTEETEETSAETE